MCKYIINIVIIIMFLYYSRLVGIFMANHTVSHSSSKNSNPPNNAKVENLFRIAKFALAVAFVVMVSSMVPILALLALVVIVPYLFITCLSSIFNDVIDFISLFKTKESSNEQETHALSAPIHRTNMVSESQGYHLASTPQ